MAGLGGRMLMAAVAGAGVSCAAWATAQRDVQHARNWSSPAHLKFPASSNYPDLSKHNNHMAKILTPAVSIPMLFW